MQTTPIKFKLSNGETRRVPVSTPVTFAAVHAAASSLLLAENSKVARLAYDDVEGDRVAFSTDAELADAFAQRTVASPAFCVFVTSTTNTTTTTTTPPIVSANGVVESNVVVNNDEQMWAQLPQWFKAKVVAKCGANDGATELAAFLALPEAAKARVRARAAQLRHWQAMKEAKCAAKQAKEAAKQEAKGAKEEPVSEEADRAMWAALMPWVRFKIAAKSARHGIAVTQDVHDFANFVALPEHVKAKVRAKAAKCAGRQGHGPFGFGQWFGDGGGRGWHGHHGGHAQWGGPWHGGCHGGWRNNNAAMPAPHPPSTSMPASTGTVTDN